MTFGAGQPVAPKTLRMVGVRIRTVARLAAISAVAFVVALAGVIGGLAFAVSRTQLLHNAGGLVSKLTGAHLHLLNSAAMVVYAVVALFFVVCVICSWVATAWFVHLFLRLVGGVKVVVTRETIGVPTPTATWNSAAMVNPATTNQP